MPIDGSKLLTKFYTYLYSFNALLILNHNDLLRYKSL